jgi:hypothetical protein
VTATGRQRLLAFAAAAFTACASVPAASPDPPCAGFLAPQRLTVGKTQLPDSFLTARVGGEVVDEVVIEKDGSVGAIRAARSRIPELAPFGEASVRHSRFTAASIEGNPVASRILVSTQVGIPPRAHKEYPFDTLWAYVPAGQSREARWQLAGSVERLSLTAHLGTAAPAGARIVAIAPGGAESVIWKGTPAAVPFELRETVKVGNALSTAGDHRLELRAGGKVLASTTVTIAADFTAAIVNACEPL